MLKQKAREQAEVLREQALDHAETLKEKANELKEHYNVEELAETHGVNTLLGRAPTPDDNSALWQRAVDALDLTYVTDRVVAMGMPHDRRQEMLDAAKARPAAPDERVASLLNSRTYATSASVRVLKARANLHVL